MSRLTAKPLIRDALFKAVSKISPEHNQEAGEIEEGVAVGNRDMKMEIPTEVTLPSAIATALEQRRETAKTSRSSSDGDWRARFAWTADRINSFLEKRFWRVTAVVLAVFLAYSIFQDLRMKMWYDEFFTLYMARQSSPAEIVKATMEGTEMTPPLYAIIVRPTLPLVRHEALAIRLPSTLGFYGMLLCILAFCRRRVPAAYAFIAALLVCTAIGYYATEGRCYGMVLFCAAGALLCWQAATESKPRILAVTLFGLCLSVMTALHYYSIFFLVPLALAELVRWRNLGKPDLAIMGAMAAPLAVLAVHYPLIVTGRRSLSHYWPAGIASWSQVPEFYALSFSLVPLCIFLVALIVAGMFSDPSADREIRHQPVLAAHEWVAIGMLALMPLVVVGVAKYTTHVFLNRYALWTVIGMAILTAAVLRLTSRNQPVVGLAVLGLLISILAGQHFVTFSREMGPRESEAVRRALLSLPDGPEPIVIGYDRIFMELSYDAEPRLRERIVYLLSRNLDLKYRGHDVNALNLSALRHRSKLHILDLGDFLEANPRFVIAVHSRDPRDYLPQYLLTEGYRMVPIGSGATPVLYEVERRGSP